MSEYSRVHLPDVHSFQRVPPLFQLYILVGIETQLVRVRFSTSLSDRFCVAVEQVRA